MVAKEKTALPIKGVVELEEILGVEKVAGEEELVAVVEEEEVGPILRMV